MVTAIERACYVPRSEIYEEEGYWHCTTSGVRFHRVGIEWRSVATVMIFISLIQRIENIEEIVN